MTYTIREFGKMIKRYPRLKSELSVNTNREFEEKDLMHWQDDLNFLKALSKHDEKN